MTTDLLKVSEVAERCGVSEKVVRGAIKRGQLRATTLGSSVLRVRPEWMDAWIDGHPVKVHTINHNDLRQPPATPPSGVGEVRPLRRKAA